MALAQAFGQVNWIAILLGGVFNTIVGTLWYGPLFGKLWLELIGKKKEEITVSAAVYIGPFVTALVSALVLALVIEGFGISSWWQGIVMGALLWIGIGAAATLTTSVFEGKKKGLWLLYALYQLLVFMVLGLVFVVW
ncbi:MAG TPA: DUF1761 domain-containing protein [Spirochaetia bacterium]|nr:DUF1761 domain-containing protein [Spirochaetia bacterium]